jgi:predicted NBD/HSP70 family sugar kinase
MPAKTDDASRMRTQNSGLLLNLIWQERSISRTELARRTGLSKTVITELVGDLVATELVREASTGGGAAAKPSPLLSFRDDAFVIIGIELAVDWVHVVVTDLRGCVRTMRHKQHPVIEDSASSLRLLNKLIDSCLQELRVPSTRILGIGVGVPAPIDLQEPDKWHPKCMPDWQGVSIIQRLNETYACPVYVENDANVGAIAERWWGAGVGGEDLAFLQIATGVGAGLILSGQLYRGSGGSAGEIGHTAVDPRGPRCLCGQSGCLGAMIGSGTLLARTEQLLKEGRPSRLSRHGLSVRAIVDAAHVGDPVAAQIVGEAGQSLGIAVASLLNLLNPAIVVLGGPLAVAGDLLLAPIRDTLRHRTLWKTVTEARILTSLLGESVIALGAATRVLEVVLADPTKLLAPRARRRAG